uniref:Uncharacterized protein n=1 Tax=Cannabis sativa TaxID=3483 RepID=A0A803QDH4_CANSA
RTDLESRLVKVKFGSDWVQVWLTEWDLSPDLDQTFDRSRFWSSRVDIQDPYLGPSSDSGSTSNLSYDSSPSLVPNPTTSVMILGQLLGLGLGSVSVGWGPSEELRSSARSLVETKPRVLSKPWGRSESQSRVPVWFHF